MICLRGNGNPLSARASAIDGEVVRGYFETLRYTIYSSMLTNPLEAVIARDALLSPYGRHFGKNKCSLIPHAISGVVPAAQAFCAQP